MSPNEILALQRDCKAIGVPGGAQVDLPKNMRVRITQELGGTFTVVTELGELFSIEGKDSDALGKAAPAPQQTIEGGLTQESLEQAVWEQLKTCYDPEIPHNIVDLGLIYECCVKPSEKDKYNVFIKMTLTAPGCGMGDWIRHDAMNKVKNIHGVREVQIDIVFDPPWDRTRMSKKLQRYFNML